ncbi:MAG: deoxyribonuclease IV [Chloroflexota bacterium]
MSNLLLGAHMSIAGGVSQALDRASSIGSNAVQIFTKNNRQWAGPAINEDDVQRWQKEMPTQGIDYVVSHASYLINLASPKDPLWQKSQNAHADELNRAHAYGVPHVVLHPGAHTGSGLGVGVERVAAALNQIHQQHPECRDTVTLLEIMAGQGTTVGHTFGQLAQIIELVDEKDRVAVCLDTCHAFAAGYDLSTSEGYGKMMDELEQDLGIDRVKCWHFNDSKGELGSHLDRHVHIGEGEIGEEGFTLILNDPVWDGIAMILETPKDDDLKDDVKNLNKLCTLVQDTSRIPPKLVV